MSKRRIYMGVIILAAVLVYGGTSQADEQFTLRSRRGTFGFSGSGTLGGAPAAVVGLTSFDGVGGCETTALLNLAGTVIPLTATGDACSYDVNPDGTGSHSITFPNTFVPSGPPSVTFTGHFVIVDKETHFFILSDEFGGGTVAIGVDKRQAGGD